MVSSMCISGVTSVTSCVLPVPTVCEVCSADVVIMVVSAGDVLSVSVTGDDVVIFA